MSASLSVKIIRVISKTLRICVQVILILILLLLVLVLLIQTSFVQNLARKKIQTYLEGKLKTKVEIGGLQIRFPERIILRDLYLQDLQKDTLLYSRSFEVGISMFQLLRRELDINTIRLNGITARIIRKVPDNRFNYQFIVDAFSDTSTAPTPSNSKPFRFRLGTVELRNISFIYRDDAAGNETDVKLGTLESQWRAIDPAQMVFAVSNLAISDATVRVRGYKPLLPPKEESPPSNQQATQSGPPGYLELAKGSLMHVVFSYTSEPDGMSVQASVGELLLRARVNNLSKNQIQAGYIALKNSSAAFNLGRPTTNQTKAKVDTAKSAEVLWSVAVGTVDMNNNNLRYDLDDRPARRNQIDFAHINARGLSLHARNLQLDPNQYRGVLSDCSFTEQSGLTVRQLSSAFLYSSNEASLRDLMVNTSSSRIAGHVVLNYSSPETLTKRLGMLQTDLELENSAVGVRDLTLFVPTLNPMLASYRSSILRASLRARGRVNDLFLDNVEADGLGQMRLWVRGRIRGLPNYHRATFDLQFSQIQGSSTDLMRLLPRGVLPTTLQIPRQFAGSGRFNGSFDRFQSNFTLTTSQGSLDMTGSLDSRAQAYTADLRFHQLDMGYVLKKQDILGKFSGDLKAEGRGFNYKKLQGNFQLNMHSGWIKGYEYQDLSLRGSADKGNAKIEGEMEDSSLRFHLSATANLVPKFPAVQMDLQLDTMDIRGLGFSKDSLGISMSLHGDFANTDPDALDGKLDVRNLRFSDSSRKAGTDSIVLIAMHTDSLEKISLHADMADLEWKGVYKITELGDALGSTLQSYYAYHGYKPSHFDPQHWEFQMHLRPEANILTFFPYLKGSDTISARIDFNSLENDLRLDLRTPRIGSGDNSIIELQAGAETRDSSLNFLVQIKGASQGRIKLYETSLRGSVAHSQLDATLLTHDSQGKTQYLVKGRVSKIDSGFQFSFLPDSLLLNYDSWAVSPDNYLRFDTTGLFIHNLQLSNEQQSISLNSSGSTAHDPIVGKFNQFQIKTISAFLNQDSLQISGILDGKMEISNLNTRPAFTADLKISQFAYQKDTIGNVQINVNNLKEDLLDAHIAINGPSGRLQIQGNYVPSQEKMDLTMTVDKLDLALVKPVSMGQLKDIKGSVNGTLHISGSLSSPVLLGSIQLDSTSVQPTLSGERFAVKADQIAFQRDGLHLKDLVFTDASGNQATLNGTLLTSDFKHYQADLNLRANTFRLINAPQSLNQQYFGKLVIDANLRIRGDLRSPRVNADFRVDRQTDFTVLLPSDDPEVVSREGVVIFLAKSQLQDSDLLTHKDSAARVSSLTGMEVAGTVQTDSNARFTLIIDERNGDALTMRGRADLVGGIDRTGKISLSGNYEVDEGAYNVTLSVLRRTFNITRGSTITWTGAPEKAVINIEATYAVKAAPFDLVWQQISGLSQTEQNRFRQKLPFLVTLKMRGELLKPVISFDITLPDYLSAAWPDVVTRLGQIRSDEAEMNKQVFALLILNQFVPENPFGGSGTGYDAGIIARQSVSSILSQQLNNLAGSLIKGVDLNFDFTSTQDFSTGQEQTQTQLNVALSKNLFNDRVSVRVGSNFQLENVLPGQSPATLAGDISAEYKLSRDGRYRIRAYRLDQYNSIVQGQIVETGLSFILTFEYDRFRELFQRTHSNSRKNGEGKSSDQSKADQ